MNPLFCGYVITDDSRYTVYTYEKLVPTKKTFTVTASVQLKIRSIGTIQGIEILSGHLLATHDTTLKLSVPSENKTALGIQQKKIT